MDPPGVTEIDPAANSAPPSFSLRSRITRRSRRSRRHPQSHAVYGKATGRRERRIKPQFVSGIASLRTSEALSAAFCREAVDKCA